MESPGAQPATSRSSLMSMRVRDRETIDAELRLLREMRQLIRELGGMRSSRQVDELLDRLLDERGETPVGGCESR
jgi:hypothetical protein